VLRSPTIAACLLSILLGAAPAAQSRGAAQAPAPAGITWLILVDDLHLDFRNTGYIRELLRSISTTLIRDEDAVAVRSSGPSSIAIGPTFDRAIVDTASQRVAGNGLQPREISEELKNPTGEIDVRLTVTFATASTLLESVPASPDRRRAMLYISNGYDAEHGRALASLFARAARWANVIVVAVNAAGLPGSVDVSRVDPEVWKQVVASRRESLRAIAEPTGGVALLDDADFADALSRIRSAVLTLR
jgi:hypothetical protein